MSTPFVRAASWTEHRAWLSLVAERDKLSPLDLPNSYALVQEDYSTDSPGYQGAVGFLIWGGSPEWITIFLQDHKGAWFIELDTARLLEGDQRGEFEKVNEELGKGDAALVYGSIAEVLDNEGDLVTELFDTGTATLKLSNIGRSFELTLNVKEVPFDI